MKLISSLLSILPLQNGCLQKTATDEGIICQKYMCHFFLSVCLSLCVSLTNMCRKEKTCAHSVCPSTRHKTLQKEAQTSRKMHRYAYGAILAFSLARSSLLWRIVQAAVLTRSFPLSSESPPLHRPPILPPPIFF